MGTKAAHRHGPGAVFDDFVRATEPRLRRALVAAFGPEAGREATVDALAWAWRHWDRVEGLDSPVGYLYRVGRTKARDARPRPVDRVPVPVDIVPDGLVHHDPPVTEPGLGPALLVLTEHQRVAVVLCHGFQWTHREVGELMELSPSTVQNHVERGLANLRRSLEGAHDG